jgi:small subunit ribosomal protein S17
MADEKDTTEEAIPAIEETEVAEVAAADDAAVEAEATADVDADVAADADAAVAEEPAERVPSITTASTPKQRREAREKARRAEAGTRPTRTPEERQAERDASRKAKAAARSLRRGQEREKYKASEHERALTPPRPHVVGLQKTRQGIVTSDKAAKTITVRIDVSRPHRKYYKIVRTSMTLHAHDELNDAHIGDTVVVTESRPLSATKRWRLVEVVERAK